MQNAPARDHHPTTSAAFRSRTSARSCRSGSSREDVASWIDKGYVIVRQAVPPGNIERLVDLLWRFDEKDPNDPSTWHAPQRREHKMKELNNAGMLGDLQSSVSLGQPDGAAHLRRFRRHLGTGRISG